VLFVLCGSSTKESTKGPSLCALYCGEFEWADKPGSVVDDHLSWTPVARRLQRATRTHGRAAVKRSYLRLLRMGFAKPRRCRRAGALLPHRFSFSPACRGVFFSVALSVGSPRPAVSWHPALGSPDFPHHEGAVAWPTRVWYSTTWARRRRKGKAISCNLPPNKRERRTVPGTCLPT